MNEFRFSPIETKKDLIEAVKYVANQTSQMANEIIGQSSPISSLTIFSHYQDEFVYLSKLLLELGDLYNENNGPRVTLRDPIIAGSNKITHLRIRKPDTERPEVGCNDFDILNYQDFKKRYLSEDSIYLKIITRPEYEMIEFRHPAYDVLAYVVS